MKYLLVILFFFQFTSNMHAQCLTNIDFNTWSQAGNPTNGVWTVGNGGSLVNQSKNGIPTFYVSPFDLINVKINGTIKVNDGDDDFIGFVFGYNASPNVIVLNNNKFSVFILIFLLRKILFLSIK